MSTEQATAEIPQHHDNELIEPCFLDRSDWLTRPPVHSRKKIAQYLTHLITRAPVDLTSHTHRVTLHRIEGDANSTYGALLDLFTVLGDKGEALRRRLLNAAAAVLTSEQLSLLTTVIDQNDTLPPYSPHAVLSNPTTNSGDLIRQTQESSDKSDEDPLQIAGDLLNSGQVDAAQRLLEETLLASPQREDISNELLQIYHHTSNRDACINMLQQLEDRPMAAQERWVALILTLDQHQHEESTDG